MRHMESQTATQKIAPTPTIYLQWSVGTRPEPIRTQQVPQKFWNNTWDTASACNLRKRQA